MSSSMKWRREGNGLVVDEWTPDTLADRNERWSWLMRNNRPWKLVNGNLIDRESDIQSTSDALREAMFMQRTTWKPKMRELEAAGVPTMAEGTYGALAAYPLPASESALTLSATEQGLLPSAHIPIYTPIPINGLLSPQAYRVILAGVFTSVATSGTLTMTMRLGNANTSPSLGASAAQTLTASLTNGQFYIMGDMTIRTVGLPGANSTAIATFHALANSAVGGATTSWLWGTGATAVSFDSTISAGANGGGLWTGVTFSANFPTMTLQQIHMMDWN
jgi:hypothetical protein